MARPDVFISYSRGESTEFADAIQCRLGGTPRCFVDRSNIETLAEFPKALSEAILNARVVVVILGPRYARSGYCWKEWLISLGPLSAARARHLDQIAVRRAHAHIVPVLHPDARLESHLMLLTPLGIKNLPSADDTEAVAGAVERLLATRPITLRELFVEFQVDPSLEEILTNTNYVFQLPQKAGSVPCYPIKQRDRHASIGQDFVGRADDFLRLHWALLASVDNGAAALTASLVAHGGYGKTRLALEYFHRVGPILYPGGNIWLDASGDAEGYSLIDQLTDIDRMLRERYKELLIPRAAESRDSLALSLRHVGEKLPILWVIDNLPDTGSVGQLSDYCPAAKDVTILITTRRRIDWPGVTTLALDVLEPSEAVALLRRKLNPEAKARLSLNQWHEFAETVGRLPLALEILNAALVSGLDAVDPLFHRIRQGDPAEETDALCADLRELLPERVLRGVVEAFQISLGGLDDPNAKELLLRLAWLAPAPIPRSLLAALSVDSDRIDRALVRLGRTSWLPFREETDHRQLHRVLAAYLRAIQPNYEGQNRFAAVCGIVKSQLSGAAPHRVGPLSELAQIVPHVNGLTENELLRPSVATWSAAREVQVALSRASRQLLDGLPRLLEFPHCLLEARNAWCWVDRLGLVDLVESWKENGADDELIRRRLLDYRNARAGDRVVQAQVLQAIEQLAAGDCFETPQPPMSNYEYEEYFAECGLPDRGSSDVPMVLVPPNGVSTGVILGSPTGDPASDCWETPRHKQIVDPFLLSATPVTWDQYGVFDRRKRAKTRGNPAGPQRPVMDVTWWEAWLYCRWMGGDLPTESQWEFACRSGSSSAWSSGDDERDTRSFAWTELNSGSQVQDVATRKPNDWGLFDMHGNVWEWCRDWWNPYILRSSWSKQSDLATGGRVIRGGSAWDSTHRARSAFRNWELPWLSGQLLGFRLARPTPAVPGE